MKSQETVIKTPAGSLDLVAGRRSFIKSLGASAVGAAIFAAAEGDFSVAYAQSVTDVDILNFALNLEYLEASFYLFAVTGQGLSASDIGANPGTVSGGAQVPFSSPLVKAYAMEIAIQERTHVEFLRSALGTSAVSRPNLNIGTAFTAVAQAAGVVSSSQTFNPYDGDVDFLLGSYIFEDVGVTAYHGALSLLTNKAYIAPASGIMAIEAYHSGIIRTSLFAQQVQQVSNITSAISQTRSALANSGNPNVDDVGIGSLTSPHLTVADSNAVAFSRSTTQVLNIVYGATGKTGTGGAFFPERHEWDDPLNI